MSKSKKSLNALFSSPLSKEDHVIRRKSNGQWETVLDSISIEEPLEIQIGKKTLVITMRTPGHDDELATGFLISESVINSPQEISTIHPCPLSHHPNRIQITLSKKLIRPSPELRRYGTISSSCGICGKQSIEEVLKTFEPISRRSRVSLQTILKIPDLFTQHQSSFQKTGGLHAAGLFDSQGKNIILREDVGRHNAVDKVIGWCAQNNLWPPEKTILMVSGRISFEIIQKALAARIPIILGVSAPSSLAISFARQSGQTLIGFLRPPRFNVYSHIESLDLEIDGD